MSVTTVASASPASEPANPLTLYPRRPGAKFEDIEARPHVLTRVNLRDGLTPEYGLALDQWTRESRTAVPTSWHYADADTLERANHADGFVAHPEPTREVLHLKLHTSDRYLFDIATVVCTLTDPSGGKQFLPFLPPTRPFPPPDVTTTTTVAMLDLDAYVAIDARHGPMYVRCGIEPEIALSRSVAGHLVWRINV